MFAYTHAYINPKEDFMKKEIAAVLFLLGAFTAAYAQEQQEMKQEEKKECKATINVNFLTIPGSSYDVDGLRLNLFFGSARNVNGYSVSAVNLTTGDFTGLEAGFVNITEGNFTGIRSGFVNTDRSFTGIENGFVNAGSEFTGLQNGFVNVLDKSLLGAQAGIVNTAKEIQGYQAGIMNISENIKGYQARFVNAAGKVRGGMAGFINIADELEGINLGAINIIKGGFGKISLYSATDTLYNAAFKSGREYYGIIGAGYDHRGAGAAERFKLTAGLGYHAVFTEFFFTDFELHNNLAARDINKNITEDDICMTNEIKVLPGIKLGAFEIFAGPSFKYYRCKDTGYHYEAEATAGVSFNIM